MVTTCSAVTVAVVVVVVNIDVEVGGSNASSDGEPDVAPTIATAAIALNGTSSSPATTDAVSRRPDLPPVPRSAIVVSFVGFTDEHTMRDVALTVR
jgi:hypothetical protein